MAPRRIAPKCGYGAFSLASFLRFAAAAGRIGDHAGFTAFRQRERDLQLAHKRNALGWGYAGEWANRYSELHQR